MGWYAESSLYLVDLLVPIKTFLHSARSQGYYFIFENVTVISFRNVFVKLFP